MKVYGLRYNNGWIAVEIETEKAVLRVNKLMRMKDILYKGNVYSCNNVYKTSESALSSVTELVTTIILFDEDFKEVRYV